MKVLRPHIRDGKETSDEIVVWDEEGKTYHPGKNPKKDYGHFTDGRELVITKDTLKKLHGIEA